jgi:hypothetical protein
LKLSGLIGIINSPKILISYLKYQSSEPPIEKGERLDPSKIILLLLISFLFKKSLLELSILLEVIKEEMLFKGGN